MVCRLDTVPNAGAYDGTLGVVLAITLLQALERRNLPVGIEVVGFSEEEGVRFGAPFIGSRALVGRLDDEFLNRQDEQGISVRKAIQEFGLNPEEISRACIDADTLGYIEFHIEQGPVLEELGRPLGVVEAIAGQSRVEFTFVGRANHAGTTPMHLRYDAMAAAAEDGQRRGSRFHCPGRKGSGGHGFPWNTGRDQPRSRRIGYSRRWRQGHRMLIAPSRSAGGVARISEKEEPCIILDRRAVLTNTIISCWPRILLSAPPYQACESASLSCMSVQPWVQDLRSTPLNSKPVGNWEALPRNDLCS